MASVMEGFWYRIASATGRVTRSCNFAWTSAAGDDERRAFRCPDFLIGLGGLLWAG